MDVATITNFLLFLGAFGASLALNDDSSASSSSRDDQDSLYDSADYSRTDRLGDEADDVTAETDNLAWFLEGGDDRLSGSSGADFADLGAGNDAADMGAGNDIVRAGTGADSLAGGTGADILLGGEDDDRIDGGLDNDSLGGEAGDDLLTGGSGMDILSGGDGNDVISGFGSLGGATGSMTGADGIDQLFGGNGDDSLLMGRGDLATGGAGADSFEMDARWRDGTGSFSIRDFDRDEDSLVLHYIPSVDPDTSEILSPEIEVRLSADGLSSLVVVDGAVLGVVEGVTDLTADDITLQPDTETDADYRPEAFDTALPGSADDDDATGGAGEDYGRFGLGDDAATGGEGHDSLLGESGEDSLSGEAGNDTLEGGLGDDGVSGGAGNDMLQGGAGEDVLTGDDGADRIWGGGGNDILSGGDADRAGGRDSAIDGADTLSGGDGDDQLLIGRGDTGIGGSGEDVFWLDAASNATATAIATLQDYLPETDRIELHYDPAFDAAGVEIPPTVSVLMGPGSAYAVITFNGEPLAHVTGATTLSLADLVLVRNG